MASSDALRIAVIPARGGSKSISRKNLLPLHGVPLVAVTIRFALASGIFSRIDVLTDDCEIADVALREGASVPYMRGQGSCADNSRDFEVMSEYLEHSPHLPESTIIAYLKPTYPFRSIEFTKNAVAEFEARREATSLRSVRIASESPFKMWLWADASPLDWGTSLLALSHDKEPYNAPRQELPNVYWQDGALDLLRPSTITLFSSFSGPRILLKRNQFPSPDIDYWEDLLNLDTLPPWAHWFSPTAGQGRRSPLDRSHPS